MPTYEVAFIMRKMAHPATVQALKRAAGEIYSSGGYIRYYHKYSTDIFKKYLPLKLIQASQKTDAEPW